MTIFALRFRTAEVALVCSLIAAAAFCFADEQKVGPSQTTAAGEKGTADKASDRDAGSPWPKALTPARAFDLQPFNFRRLSPLRGRDESWHLAFEFFDEDRLLITFESAEMVRRLRSCPKTHDDRVVHAILLNPHSGEVLRRADWYLHDRRQYLWPLSSGQMLLRRGGTLLQVDRDLNEKAVLEQPNLVWLDVTPDGKQIMMESESDKADAKASASPHRPKYEVRFLDAATLAVLETFPLDRPMPLKATADGYADVVLKNGWTWLIRFGGPGKQRLPVTRVRSSCIPDLEISGEKTLLIGRCTTAQDRYVMSSFTTAGQFLWRQHWPQELSTPLVSRSTSGTRFALSTIAVTGKSSSTVEDEEEKSEVRVQRIELFNAATGTSALRLETQPVVTVGGNFAISPEGTMLAVLRDARVELYELPILEKDEETKFAAVRAGTPGLLVPGLAIDPAEDAELAADEAPAVQAAAAPGAQGVGSSASHDRDHGVGQNPPGATGNTTNETGADNSGLTFHANSHAVVVDVVVTDSKGHPIAGLKPSDFTVSEDGSPQKLDYFEEHSLTSVSQAPPPEFRRPANIFSNISINTQPDSATLILLDMLNTQVPDQAHVREALTRYIKRKPKNESFALCVLAGPLRLVRGFTTDENELLLGMLDKRAKPSASLISQMDTASLSFIRSATQKLTDPTDTTRSFATAMAGMERTIQDEQMSQDDMRTYMTIMAFGELARYMAGVPGRKKVLWLSAAFPLGVFADANGLDAGPFHQQRDFLQLIRRTMNLLASAHVSVYPVDVRGITTTSVLDVAENAPFSMNLPNSPLTNPSGTTQQGTGGTSPAAASAALNMANDHAVPLPGFSGRTLEDSGQRNSEHAAMDLVAEQTGGKAFYGSNDITDALRTVVEQGADYYTLSYNPSNRKYDGRFRKIHVKVAEHGYRVSHRSGYYADDPNRLPANAEAVQQSMANAGMLHGSPESRQIPFEVRIVPMGEPKTVDAAQFGFRKQDKNAPSTLKLQHYGVDFAIAAAPLRFDAGPEGVFHGKFRLLANSFDSEGRPLLQAASTAVADLQATNYQKVLADGLRLHHELDVPVNAGFLRLGVGDLTSAYIGTLELPLPIPVAKGDPLSRKDGALPPVEPE